MSEEEKLEVKEPHCAICHEIREGCEAERLSGVVPDCEVCHKKGFIDLGDGTGIACNACKRGYRMKLWLTHQKGRTNDMSPISIGP